MGRGARLVFISVAAALVFIALSMGTLARALSVPYNYEVLLAPIPGPLANVEANGTSDGNSTTASLNSTLNLSATNFPAPMGGSPGPPLGPLGRLASGDPLAPPRAKADAPWGAGPAPELPSHPVASLATGATLGLLVAMALAEASRCRLVLPFLPLFSRINRDNLLDHSVRRSLYLHIKDHPGIHFNALRHALGLSNGSAMFHLARLQRVGLVSSLRIRGRRVFFIGPRLEAQDLRGTISPLQRLIVDHLGGHPGIPQKAIARDLYLKPARVSYNIGVLERAGLVRVERQGRRALCYPTPAAGTLEGPSNPP